MEYITPEMNVKVDEGLKELMPVQMPEEIQLLRASIKEEGVRDPITIWAETGLIVDGMTRYRLASEEGVQIPYVLKSFDDILAVQKWMYEVQAGRRNLTDRQRLSLASGYRQILKERLLQAKVQEVDLLQGKKTAEVAAEKFRVSDKSIKRYDAIVRDGVEEVQVLLKNETIPLSTTAHLIRLVPEVQKDIITKVVSSSSGDVDVTKLKAEIEAARQKAVEEASWKEVLANMPDEEAKLESNFKSFFEGSVKVLVASKTDEEARKNKTIMEVRWQRLDGLPSEIKRMLIAREVRVEDVEALLNKNEAVLATMTSGDIARKASAIRAENREAFWQKRMQSIQKREDTKKRQEEEERLIADKEKLRRGVYAVLQLIRSRREDGVLYCPIHGPSCKLEFECGLDLDAAINAALEDISLLVPEMIEVEKKEIDEVRLADGSKTEVTRYTKVLQRKEGDFGKVFREEV